jgi:Leucine-rich repeat (LRR) protein
MITALPGALAGCTSLEMLDAYRNPLTTLPEELGGLPALKWIGVEEEVLPDTLRRFGS